MILLEGRGEIGLKAVILLALAFWCGCFGLGAVSFAQPVGVRLVMSDAP